VLSHTLRFPAAFLQFLSLYKFRTAALVVERNAATAMIVFKASMVGFGTVFFGEKCRCEVCVECCTEKIA
jgi:hypothetical protein